MSREDDNPAAIAAEMHREAERAREWRDEREADVRLPSDIATAWRLFEHISTKDPQSTGGKDEALAVFKECLDTVRYRRPSAWELALRGEGQEDDVPF